MLFFVKILNKAEVLKGRLGSNVHLFLRQCPRDGLQDEIGSVDVRSRVETGEISVYSLHVV